MMMMMMVMMYHRTVSLNTGSLDDDQWWWWRQRTEPISEMSLWGLNETKTQKTTPRLTRAAQSSEWEETRTHLEGHYLKSHPTVIEMDRKLYRLRVLYKERQPGACLRTDSGQPGIALKRTSSTAVCFVNTTICCNHPQLFLSSSWCF